MIYQWLIQVSHIVCSFNIFLSSSVTSEPEKRANFLSGIINSKELLFSVLLPVRQGWFPCSEDKRKQANLLFCRLYIFGSLVNQKLGQQQQLWSFSVTTPDLSTGNFKKPHKFPWSWISSPTTPMNMHGNISETIVSKCTLKSGFIIVLAESSNFPPSKEDLFRIK